MGNLVGYNIYYKYPDISSFRALFEAFQLSPRDVEKLYRVFCTLDSDRSGLISTAELFEFLEDKEGSIKFCDRIFTLFDEDASGQIDFREFVVALWNYCTLSHSSLIIFAFDLYDTDETGELSPDEVDNMLKDLYGAHADTHIQAKQIRKDILSMDRKSFFTIDKFREFVRSHPALLFLTIRIRKDILSMDRKSFFTIDKFREFVRSHPALLFPAFKMQLALQHTVLGTSFWQRCSGKRVRLSDGRRVKIEIIKSMNTQDYMHRKVIASDAVNLGSLSGKTRDTMDGFHVTHPKQQVAALILKATGTLHYRRGDANRQKDKNLFLTANQCANEKYVLETYAQSKLRGLQPWGRHAKYIPVKMPVRRTLPNAAFVGETEPSITEKKPLGQNLNIKSQKDVNVEKSSPTCSITIVERFNDNVTSFSENDCDCNISQSTSPTTKRNTLVATVNKVSPQEGDNTALIVKRRHQRNQKLKGKYDNIKIVDLEISGFERNNENR